MADDKLFAAIMAAVNAYIQSEEVRADPPRQNLWSYNGRLSAVARQYTWVRRPRS